MKLQFERIESSIDESWVKFYQENYENPSLNYDLILIRRHKLGNPEIIDGINGSEFCVARLALEAIHNQKFTRERGFDIIKNSLLGDWIDWNGQSGDLGTAIL